MSKQLIDFQGDPASTTADTGEDQTAAIRPVANTEPASEATFNRPTENLRARTEILRKELEGIKYLLDADRAILLSGGGAINWNATAGTFTIAQNMSVRPFMSPAASKEAKLVVGDITVTADKTKTKPQRAYGRMDDEYGRGANDISVEFVANASATSEVVVTVTGAPANNVKVVFSTNPSLPVNAAGLVSYLTNDTGAGATAFRNLGLKATVTGTGTNAPTQIAVTRLQGALDAELHVITPAGLVTFFNTAANALLDGDCLVVAYDKLVEPTGAGGRRQSLRDDPEKSSASPTQTDITVVDNNLANLSAHPEKVTHAIPICTREGTDLVFLDGTRIRTGIAGSLGGIGSNVGETISGNLNVTGKVLAAQSDTGSGFATADTAKARFRGAASTANTTLVVEAAAGQTGNLTAWTDASGAAKTVIDSAGLLESKVATGTAPLKVASSTKVDNLNADKLDGYDWNDVPSLGTSSTTVTAGTVNATTVNAPAINATTGAATVTATNVTAAKVTVTGLGITSDGALGLGNGPDDTFIEIASEQPAAGARYVSIGYGPDRLNSTATEKSSTQVWGHLNVYGDLNASSLIGRTQEGGPGPINIGNDSDVNNINIGTSGNSGAVTLGKSAVPVNVNGTLIAKPASSGQTDSVLSVKNSDGTTKLFDIAPDGTVVGGLRNKLDFTATPTLGVTSANVTASKQGVLDASPTASPGASLTFTFSTQPSLELTQRFRAPVVGIAYAPLFVVVQKNSNTSWDVRFDSHEEASDVYQQLMDANRDNTSTPAFFAVLAGSNIVGVDPAVTGAADGLTLTAQARATGATALKFAQGPLNTGDLWSGYSVVGAKLAALDKDGNISAVGLSSNSLSVSGTDFTVNNVSYYREFLYAYTTNSTTLTAGVEDNLFFSGTYGSGTLAHRGNLTSAPDPQSQYHIFGGFAANVTYRVTLQRSLEIGAQTGTGVFSNYSLTANPSGTYTIAGQTATSPLRAYTNYYKVSGLTSGDTPSVVLMFFIKFTASGGTMYFSEKLTTSASSSATLPVSGLGHLTIERA